MRQREPLPELSLRQITTCRNIIGLEIGPGGPIGQRAVHPFSRQGGVAKTQLGEPELDLDARENAVVVGGGEASAVGTEGNLALEVPGLLILIMRVPGIAIEVERGVAQPHENDTEVGAGLVVVGMV